MTPSSPSVATETQILPLRTCRFYVAGVAVRVVFCPQAEIHNIRETMPPPEGLEIVMPCEESGPGCFQVQLRPTESLLQRPEVADDRHPKQTA